MGSDSGQSFPISHILVALGLIFVHLVSLRSTIWNLVRWVSFTASVSGQFLASWENLQRAINLFCPTKLSNWVKALLGGSKLFFTLYFLWVVALCSKGQHLPPCTFLRLESLASPGAAWVLVSSTAPLPYAGPALGEPRGFQKSEKIFCSPCLLTQLLDWAILLRSISPLLGWCIYSMLSSMEQSWADCSDLCCYFEAGYPLPYQEKPFQIQCTRSGMPSDPN